MIFITNALFVAGVCHTAVFAVMSVTIKADGEIKRHVVAVPFLLFAGAAVAKYISS